MGHALRRHVDEPPHLGHRLAASLPGTATEINSAVAPRSAPPHPPRAVRRLCDVQLVVPEMDEATALPVTAHTTTPLAEQLQDRGR